MNFISLFSGIECASVAFAPLGWRPLMFSEIDRFCCALLKHHYPEVPNHGDVTRYESWPDYPAVDVLVGGSPCQSFSPAGRRGGIRDPRGRLTYTYLDVVGRYRPSWVVWENSAGVLSADGGRAFGGFLGGLAQLGYGFAYRVLDAKYFGVAQRRRRVFVVASARSWRCAAAVLFERQSLQGNSQAGSEAWADAAATIGSRPARSIGTLRASRGGPDVAHAQEGSIILTNAEGAAEGEVGLTESNVGKQHNNQSPLLVFDQNQITSPGNRNNPQPGDPCHTLAAHDKAPVVVFDRNADTPTVTVDGTTPTLRAMNGEHRNDGSHLAVAIRMDQTGANGDPLSVDVAPTLNTGKYQHAVAFKASHYTRGRDGKQSDQAYALTAEADKGDQDNLILHVTRVRRLTPLECERLQGLPDNYTRIPYGRKTKGGLQKFADDAPRYRAIGNGWAVPVPRWIARRIDMVEALCQTKNPE